MNLSPSAVQTNQDSHLNARLQRYAAYLYKVYIMYSVWETFVSLKQLRFLPNLSCEFFVTFKESLQPLNL